MNKKKIYNLGIYIYEKYQVIIRLLIVMYRNKYNVERRTKNSSYVQMSHLKRKINHCFMIKLSRLFFKIS